MAKYEPEVFVDAIQNRGANATALVPTMVARLLAMPDMNLDKMKNLRMLGYAGAPMAPEQIKQCYETITPNMVQYYGLVEAIPPVTVLSAKDHKDGIYTTVKGIYCGQAILDPTQLQSADWISDGVWKLVNGRFWILSAVDTDFSESGNSADGLFLVTESETFIIQRGGKQYVVRDFTEVGASQIDTTYEMLDFFIHKKPQT